MDRIAPASASFAATMTSRAAVWPAPAVETRYPTARPDTSDLRLFLTAFVGGFLFFSVLIA